MVRLAPAAAARLSGAAAQAVVEADEAEAGGWVRALVPIESEEQACREFLALGADIEVLEPPALRARLAAAARATAALYRVTRPLRTRSPPIPARRNFCRPPSQAGALRLTTPQRRGSRDDADRDPVDAARVLGRAADHRIGPGRDPERFGDLIEQRLGAPRRAPARSAG